MDKITLSTIGTYKEIEYLKKTLGPVLVSALAEICVKRPADPIEYLGHWLLRWRYNEELKRRDMENALEVIRQRQKAKCEQETGISACKLPLDPYGEGVLPSYPILPPGYGGPVCPGDLEGLLPKEEEEEEEEEEPYEMLGEDYDYVPRRSGEMPGEGGYFGPELPQYYYPNNEIQGADPNNPNAYQYGPNEYQYPPGQRYSNGPGQNQNQYQYDPNAPVQTNTYAAPYPPGGVNPPMPLPPGPPAGPPPK